MSNNEPTPEPGLYAFYFDELMAIQAFVNDDSAVPMGTLVQEDVWTYIQSDDGKARVKEWCDLHRLDFRQLAACPPADDWKPGELEELLKRARKLFDNVTYRVRTAQKIERAAARHQALRNR